MKNNLLLAPLAGYTDAGFRAVAIRHGAALAFSEMVSAKGLLYNGVKTEELLFTSKYEIPCAVQLFGKEPEIFRRAAASPLLEKFNIIDINMGCPVPKIVKNGEGAALMKDKPLVMEIIAAVKDGAPKKTVTAKIRSGFDRVNAPEIAAALEEAGADAVTVHARLRSQFYAGAADYSVIKEVKRSVKIPVAGNGDVRSKDDYLRLREYTGCDLVMIGRAAVGNPRIFGEISGAETDGHAVAVFGEISDATSETGVKTDKKADVLLQLEILAEYCGGHALTVRAKKHIAAYSKGMKNSKIIKILAMGARSIEELKRIAEKYMSADNY